MSVIAQADSLMEIFGFHRVKCCHCVHSIGTDSKDMLCTELERLVKADDQCELYMREPGSEGDDA